MIVIDLSKRLPRPYVAAPHVHLGTGFEVDIAASDDELLRPSFETTHDSNGGTATAVYRANDQRLVAAVEIVSPSNKDRPESRRAFIAKCAALLRQGVSVSIVDLVTSKPSNLYLELLAYLGESDPSFSLDPSSIYAVACRWNWNRPTKRPAKFCESSLDVACASCPWWRYATTSVGTPMDHARAPVISRTQQFTHVSIAIAPRSVGCAAARGMSSVSPRLCRD
jgi:hypothetical protein